MKSHPFSDIPFENIERVGQMSQLYRDLFSVSWILGRFCNYSCSYCWPYASSKQKDHQPLDQIIKTIDSIKSQAKERGFNSFHFSFSGGEPTLHPNYLEILKYLNDDTSHRNYQSVHMTTNLSAGLGWFKKYTEATKDLHRVSITASYHKEFAEKVSFAEKLIFLQQQDIQTTINMVMVPDRFDILMGEAEYFHSLGLNVTLKPQSNIDATKIVEGYTKEQLDFLQNGLPQMDFTTHRRTEMGRPSTRPKNPIVIPEYIKTNQKNVKQIMQVELNDTNGKAWYIDQAERLNAFEFNKFKDWICSSGYRSLIIREPGGVIKRSYSCADKPLGSIADGFKLFSEPQVCKTNSCVSSADSKIPKKKSTSKLPLWP
jgi:organic radical activating enzyme